MNQDEVERRKRRMLAQWRVRTAKELVALGLSPEQIAAEGLRAERRLQARLAWISERMAALRAAQKAADAAWTKQITDHPEVEDWDAPDAPQLPDPPEQAALDAIWAELRAVCDHDRWPKHLHFPLV